MLLKTRFLYMTLIYQRTFLKEEKTNRQTTTTEKTNRQTNNNNRKKSMGLNNEL